MAQGGTQVEFGQNRVQYHDFDWLSNESDHFVTYFYPGGQELGRFVIAAAEDRLKVLDDKLNYTLGSKIEILVYNDISDLAQTNIGISEDKYNVGGTNYTEGTKIFLYYDGDHEHLVNMLDKELTKVYLNSMMSGRNFADIVRNFVFLNLPDWFIQGLAAYIGDGWDVYRDEKLRKYWNETRKPSFAKLANSNPEFAGQSLWYFVSQTYGSSSIKNILYLTRINRSVKKGFGFAIGKTDEELIKEWEDFQKQIAVSDLQGRNKPDQQNKVKVKVSKRQTITQLRISPDGRYIAYATHQSGRYRVYLQNLESGRKKKIFTGGFNSDNYPYDFSYPLLAWNPSGTILTGISEKRDLIKQIDYDLIKKKRSKQDIRGFQRIYSATYLDGRTLLLAGQNKGQTDIYRYDLVNRTTIQLTNDVFDDVNPVPFSVEGRQGILFSSNRSQPRLGNPEKDSILPVGNFSLYFMDMENPDAELVTTRKDAVIDQTLGTKLGEGEVAYLSNESGIVNLYQGKFYPLVQRIDTLKSDGGILLDSVYSYKVETTPLSNMNANILDMSIANRVDKWAYLVNGVKKPEVYVQRLPLSETPITVPKTSFRELQVEPERGIRLQQKSNLSSESTVGNNWKILDTLLSQPTHFTFDSKYDYAFPTLSEREQQQVAFMDSLKVNSEEEYQNLVNQQQQPASNPYNIGQTVPYKAKFSSDFLTTQIDNSVLPFTYQSVAQNGTQFDYPDLSGMIMYGIKDLMENHKLTGGFRLPVSFDGSEVFLSYENLKKRLDKRILFYRKSNQENYTLLVNNSIQLPAIGKQKSNYIETRLSYPFDVTKSLRLYAGYRNDRLLLGYTDTITTIADLDKNENWSFLKLEFVHDNSKQIQLNIYKGFRYKIYTEYFRNWSEKKSNVFTVGFDARHYTTIYKNIIWANRIAGASSFGNQRVLYYLGGVDTWINHKYDNNIGVSQSVNYAFQTQVTNVRGFPINIRNGSSSLVLNSEIRVPLFSFIAKRDLKSAFIKNFQIAGFFDVGAAYNGLTPFDQENPYTEEQVTPSGQQTPVVVKVKYYRNPTVMGTGVGVRTMLLGYFMRLDWAWGIDGHIVNKKPMWIFSFSRDF